MQGFYSRPTKIGKVICFPSTVGDSHRGGFTPIEAAQSPSRNTDRTVANSCLTGLRLGATGS